MPPELNEDTRSNEELDKLADNDTARNTERPMTAADVAPDKPTKEVKPTKEETWEFTHAGKQVKGTREQVLKWASQGYAYPQLAQKMNQDKAAWEKNRQEWEKQWGPYKQIDDYAKSNKEWWDFMQKGWNSRGTATTAQPADAQPDIYAPKFQALEQKLSAIEQFAQQQIEREQNSIKMEADKKLDSEIQSIRDAHKDLDWESLDENGKSLELRILEHADQNGIPTFRAAMRDLLHDELVNKAASNGKLAVARDIQTRTKLGVLGETPTSRKFTSTSNRDMRKTSYEELQREAMDEIRSSR